MVKIIIKRLVSQFNCLGCLFTVFSINFFPAEKSLLNSTVCVRALKK